MKAILLGTVVAAVGLVGLRWLADETQNRQDERVAGTRSLVLLEVETRGGYNRSLAAAGLWAACQQAVDDSRIEPLGPRGRHRYAAVVEPALGEHASLRFAGCLEDATIDRVQGNVVGVRALDRVPR